MKIYVIRHGEVELNSKGLLNGRNNTSLTRLGINQIKDAGKKIEDIDIELIICSPLKRTVQTCNLINVNKVPVIYDERIVERDTKSLMYKNSSTIDLEIFYSSKYKIVYDDCEGFGAIIERVKALLEELKKKDIDKNILIVTHLDVSKAINCCLTNEYSVESIKDFKHQNGEIKEYKIVL